MSVRLSVCHTPVLYVNGYTYPQCFLPSGSPTIVGFPHQTGWQYSDGDPLTGAPNARRGYTGMKQEAQLAQRDRATLRVIRYFAKSLKVTQGHSK